LLGQRPKGGAVKNASMWCRHSSYNPPAGRDRRQEKHSAMDRIFATAESYASKVRARDVVIRHRRRLDHGEKTL
jgi:hypothetical protein